MRFSLSMLFSIVLLLSCMLGMSFYDSRVVCLALPFQLQWAEYSHDQRLLCYEEPKVGLVVFDLVDRKVVSKFPGEFSELSGVLGQGPSCSC